MRHKAEKVGNARVAKNHHSRGRRGDRTKRPKDQEPESAAADEDSVRRSRGQTKSRAFIGWQRPMMRLLKTNMNRAAIIILLLAGAALAQGAPSLTVGEVTYENVTLKKEYPRSFFIQHDGGTAFVERSKLNEEQIAELLGVAGDEMPAVAHSEEEPQASPTPETESKAESETKTRKALKSKRPDPDSLTSEEERRFFEACGIADTATIVAMLQKDPALAKVIVKGQSRKQILPQMVDGKITPFGEELVEASCDPLQWLIDKSEKSPGRIEAIKALVEAGADPKRTTSEVGLRISGTRGSVTLPDKLTPEELDYLLSKGADPTVGFCVGNVHPMVRLALGFVSE